MKQITKGMRNIKDSGNMAKAVWQEDGWVHGKAGRRNACEVFISCLQIFKSLYYLKNNFHLYLANLYLV